MPDNNVVLEIQKVLEKYGSEIVADIQADLRRNAKVASGKLVKSVKFRVKVKSQSIQLEILADDLIDFIESGRKAGSKQPPLDKILKWIKAKKIQPQFEKDKRPLKKKQESLAFIMARSISVKGIRPNKVIERTMKNIGDELEYEISEAARAGFEEEVFNALSESVDNKFIKVTRY